MAENNNAWSYLTDKAWNPERLPEVVSDFDNTDVTDGVVKTLTKVAKKIGKTIIETDAKPPSNPTKNPSSAPSSAGQYQKDWNTVEKLKRRLFFIFLMEEFDDSSIHSRDGAEHDAARLNKSMARLGFEVRIFKNKTKDQAGLIFDRVKKMDLNNIEVFGMAISSHGSEDNLIYMRDTDVDLNFFADPVKE